ncbi:putative U6 snRNA-associated Sm-like protein LSm8 [Monocercomonoides exilis]|uniref:putative U6 snRNA-associated Sm-like protein LSm8 n=1 Tax=Monocercomonoides exilis TaxID=2049356 RepID=UPI00355A2CB4|nr:putative U6 snRNA-associated Sm-like protein LSm8 [Monocercomonoides exilis]
MADYLERTVQIVTNDGKIIVGKLRGIDDKTNCLLQNCEERVFSMNKDMESIPLGVYIIRGDSIACIGEVDVDAESAIEVEKIRAPPLKPIIHVAF